MSFFISTLPLYSTSTELKTCSAIPKPLIPVLASRTNTSITWSYLPLENLSTRFKYKIVNDTSELAICKYAARVCMATDLLPGRMYTVSLIACLEDSTRSDACSDKSDALTTSTLPNAPLTAEVKGLSSTSLKITMLPSVDECGIDRYTANISDNGSLSCELKKGDLEFSCVIHNLSPLTEYVVNITAWLGGKFSEVGSKVQKSGWTRPLTPTRLIPAHRDTNSLAWNYEPLNNSNQAFIYKVVNETSHLATCNESVKLCNATGLMAGTIYKASLIVCLNTSTKAEICSEKSVSAVSVTSPSTPCGVEVKPHSSTSLKVSIEPPDDYTGIDRYTVSIANGSLSHCELKREDVSSSCLLKGLSPASLYCINITAWLGGDFRYVGSSIQKRGWTKPSVPRSLSVKQQLPNSLIVSFERPTDAANIQYYEVYLQDFKCVIRKDEILECTVKNLNPATQYNTSVQSCYRPDKEVICSDPVFMSGWTKPNKFSSTIVISERSANAIKVNFQRNKEDVESKLLSYFVQVQTLDTQYVLTVKCGAVDDTVSCAIEGLSSCMRYSLKVLPCLPNTVAMNESCGEAFREILTGTIPRAPTLLSIQSVAARSCKLMWKAPANSGLIEMYEIAVSQVDGVQSEIKKYCYSTQCEVEGLFGNTKYSMTVRSWCSASKEFSEPSPLLEMETLVDAPTFLTVTTVNAECVRINWTNPRQNTEHLTGLIYYRDSEIQASPEGNTSVSQAIGTHSVEVAGLLPNTEYEFRVCICRSARKGVCVCSAAPAKGLTLPQTVPSILSVESRISHTLSISWLSIAQRKTDLFYEVKATNAFDATQPPKTFIIASADPVSSCSIKELSANMKYNLTMCAYRKVMTSKSCSRDVSYGRTQPDALNSLHATHISTHNITISWQNLPKDTSFLENVTLTAVKAEHDKEIRQCIFRPPLQNYCTFINLTASTNYSISGVACSPLEPPFPAVCSEVSPEIHITTLPSPPDSLTITNINPDSVHVTWLSVGGRVFDIIIVQAIARSSSTSDTKFCQADSASNNCSITGLSPETGYLVSVRSCFSENQCGDESESKSVLTAKAINMALLVALLVLAVVVVLLVILLIVLWNCPNLHQRRKVTGVLSSASNDAQDFAIAYFESPEVEYYADKIFPSVPFKYFKVYSSFLDSENGYGQLFRLLNSLALEQETALHLSQHAGCRLISLNRYADTLPYDQSLVILGRKWPLPLRDPKPAIVSGVLKTAYVNASYIRAPLRSASGVTIAAGFGTPPDYIATQGPLDTTVADFLTMLYEQRVPHVIMLCNLEEGGKSKCARYWPQGSRSGALTTFTSATRTVTVILMEESVDVDFTSRIFAVLPHDQKDPWIVNQLHVSTWNDHGVLPMEKFYLILQVHLALLAKYPLGQFGPPVVHCSAGVGRTGTFICSRFLLDQLRKDPSNIDIIGTALAIRKWRKSLVQAEIQLRFLFKFVEYVVDKEGLTPATLGATDIYGQLGNRPNPNNEREGNDYADLRNQWATNMRERAKLIGSNLASVINLVEELKAEVDLTDLPP
ncbi:hypothetical protein TcWFU_001010 [Taenia crassiceps]|uniref:Protein-tyrosine-phosphatase n=1 Tax=Taenia crassiceps TaxID=6207 RepID=A0ABR4QGI3_9CEST